MPTSSRLGHFRVTADRFDWMPNPRVIVCYTKGHEGPGTRACIEKGLATGKIEKIPKPERKK